MTTTRLKYSRDGGEVVHGIVRDTLGVVDQRREDDEWGEMSGFPPNSRSRSTSSYDVVLAVSRFILPQGQGYTADL